MVARNASTSETGSESQMPKAWSANTHGRIQMHGSRQMNCRRSESRMAVHGCPMDWK